MNTSSPVVDIPAGQASPASETALPSIMRIDGVAKLDERKELFDFLNQPGWSYGWKSSAKTDNFSFWHKHFAGPRGGNLEYEPQSKSNGLSDCAYELERGYPLILRLWRHLQAVALKDHILVRCYANGLPFGSEGTLHIDSRAPKSFTTIYYPHETWHPDWGGETVFFDERRAEIIGAIYPRPNRAVMFRGMIPHVARGVTRVCPVMRITLMFKSELP